MARLIVNETEVGGCTFQEGQMVMLPFPSANRDPEAFPEPDKVILDRAENRHLAFGAAGSAGAQPRSASSRVSRSRSSSPAARNLPGSRARKKCPTRRSRPGAAGLGTAPVRIDARISIAVARP